MSSDQQSQNDNKLSAGYQGWKPSTTDANQIKSQKVQKPTPKQRQTTFKPHSTDIHTKLYPTLEDRDDCLHCTEAEYAPYRFDYNDLESATQYLLTNGYVVIKSVLSSADLKQGKSLFWKFVSQKSIDWDRKDYKTWNIYNIGGELQNGLIWGKGIGQSKFQWFGRTHPKVLQIFSHLWSHKMFPKSTQIGSLDDDTDDSKDSNPNIINPNTDLLTSFDGIGLFTPWHMTGEYDRTNSGWFHIDQNVKMKRGIHTIQAYVSYFDQNESTGSTVIIPKTHSVVRDTLKISHAGDFVRIRKNCTLLNSALYKKILVCCKAGDMVLWDSRTIHCSSPALLGIEQMRNVHSSLRKNRFEKDNGTGMVMDLLNGLIQRFDDRKEEETEDCEVDLLRLVAMICMVPKWRLKNKKVLKMRVKAYIDKCTLSHWPTEYAVLNYPPTDIGKNQIEHASELTKSLIGYL